MSRIKHRPIVFTKRFRNDDYELLFNEFTGFEILRGINGKSDPFWLELPSLLDIGIMGTCKNKCEFCYQGHIDKPNMKLEDFKMIIKQVKHHTNQVALGGRGDPNKHKNFKEILTYCRKNKIAPNYTTSGIDLTPDEISISKICGAVAVSDYGKPFTYKALKGFIESDIKTAMHIIYSKSSHDKVIQILKGEDVWNNKIDLIKLNSIIFLLFKPHGAGQTLDWTPTVDQIKEFSDIIFNPQTIFKIGIDSCLVNRVLQYANPNKIQLMSIDTCEGSRQSAYITPDMKMMPCSFADKNKFAVQITDDKDVSFIWNNSPIFKRFRNTLYGNKTQCPLFKE